MNSRECQKIIKRFLSPSLPNFRGSIYDSLVMWPVEHLWRGFTFGYSSTRHAGYFSTCVIPLYMKISEKDSGLSCLIGNRLAGGRLFVFTPEEYEASGASLRTAVLEEGVPFLNKFATPEDIIRNLIPGGANSPNHEVLAYTHAYVGNYAEAIVEFEYVIDLYDRMTPDRLARRHPSELQRLALHRTLLHLLRTEPEKTQQLLREVEAESIVNLKLNEIK